MTRSRWATSVVIVALIAALAFLAGDVLRRPSSIQAAGFVVNSLGDAADASVGDGVCETATPDECTLRAAIQESNAQSGANTISFSVEGTIALSSGLPAVTESLTIAGTDSATLLVDGGGDHKLFEINSLGNNQTLAISGISIVEGFSSEAGGGIYVASGDTLLLTAAVVHSNESAGPGGGIGTDQGTVTVTDSTISANQSSFSGGGIYNNGGTVTLTKSTLSGNIASFYGGGIHNQNNWGSGSGTITATNVTISGNSAYEGGGGILATGLGGESVTLDSVTITGNTADANNDGAGNGGGIQRFAGTVSTANTILAGNSDLGGQAPDCSGTISSAGYNVVGNNTGCTFSGTTGDQVGTGGSPIDPLLGLLEENDGLTKTHALLSQSPAIDKGGGCPATDQRGYARPFDGDGDEVAYCDAGSYEVQEDVFNWPLAYEFALQPAPSFEPVPPGGGGQGGAAGPTPLDLLPLRFEVTQGIQNLATNLRVAAERGTFLRVYVICSFPAFPSQPCSLNNVRVRLHYLVDGVELATRDAFIGRTASPPTGMIMANMATFRFRTVGSGRVQFYIEVDPLNEVAETNELNNRYPASGSLQKTFFRHGYPKFLIVRVTDPNNRTCVTIQSPTIANYARMMAGHQWAYRTWPVPDAYLTNVPYRGNVSGPLYFNNRDLCVSRNQNRLLVALLERLDAVRRFRPSSQDPNYVHGYIDSPALRGTLGLGYQPGRAAFTTTQNPSYQNVFAHETGHNFGQGHNSSATGLVGFDIVNVAPVPSTAINFMEPFCCSLEWVTPNVWVSLSGRLDPPPGAEVAGLPGEVAAGSGTPVMVSGVIFEDGSAELNAARELAPGADTTPSLPDAKGTHRLVFKNNSNQTLATVRFMPDIIAPENDETFVGGGFVLMADMPKGTASLALEEVATAAALDSFVLSANAPSVQILYPNGGENIGGAHTISWTGSDVDGDALAYDVYTSSDNGATWDPIATNLSDTSLPYDAKYLKATSGGRIRVTASDGLRSSFDTSNAVFTVKNKPPEAMIMLPQDAFTVQTGNPVLLIGSAADADESDPLPDSAASWSSDIDGFLATGFAPTPVVLSPGLHTITLQVTDSTLLQDTDTVQVLVGTPAFLNLIPNPVDPGDPGAIAPVTAHVELPDGVDIANINTGSFELLLGDTTLIPTQVATGDYDGDGLNDFELEFAGSSFFAALGDESFIEFATITGTFQSGPLAGTRFAGRDNALDILPPICNDVDGDLVCDSYDPDADGDGCLDGRELGPDASFGGLRNPLNPWDFYDVLGPSGGPPDRVIDLFNDILGVINHWSPGGGPPYDVNYDRGPSAGPNPWNMTAPDGVIDLFNDILGVINQWGHDCR